MLCTCKGEQVKCGNNLKTYYKISKFEKAALFVDPLFLKISTMTYLLKRIKGL